MAVGAGLGATLYGCISLYGIMSMEAAPSHLAGTSHAIVSLFANCKYITQVVYIYVLSSPTEIKIAINLGGCLYLFVHFSIFLCSDISIKIGRLSLDKVFYVIFSSKPCRILVAFQTRIRIS